MDRKGYAMGMHGQVHYRQAGTGVPLVVLEGGGVACSAGRRG
jgi:hypothetical protein